MDEEGVVAVGDDGTCAHSEAGSLIEKYSLLPVDGNQEFMPIIVGSDVALSGGEAVMGLGEGEGAFALIDRGCRMLKI